MSADNQAKRIVVIEDDPEMISLVKLILGKEGYDVSSADNGRDGLTLIEELVPHAVVLDLMMPDMDGWEVYQAMKANDSIKNVPVIILTAKSQSIDKVLGLHIAKVDDYITKPFSPGELLGSIRKAITHHQNG